jgi:hypothetical protein
MLWVFWQHFGWLGYSWRALVDRRCGRVDFDFEKSGTRIPVPVGLRAERLHSQTLDASSRHRPTALKAL